MVVPNGIHQHVEQALLRPDETIHQVNLLGDGADLAQPQAHDRILQRPSSLVFGLQERAR